VLAPFSIVSGGTYRSGAGASQTVTVRYSPTASGTHNQNMNFTGGSSASRPVSGSAYNPGEISVTPASQDFGSIQVGATADRTFTVQDAGGTLSGNASVSAPFSIVAGGTYSLAAAIRNAHCSSFSYVLLWVGIEYRKEGKEVGLRPGAIKADLTVMPVLGQ
jgi:hypothetical protein